MCNGNLVGASQIMSVTAFPVTIIISAPVFKEIFAHYWDLAHTWAFWVAVFNIISYKIKYIGNGKGTQHCNYEKSRVLSREVSLATFPSVIYFLLSHLNRTSAGIQE